MVVCEICGSVVGIDYNTGDEGKKLKCPVCGKEGVLYVSIVDIEGG